MPKLKQHLMLRIKSDLCSKMQASPGTIERPDNILDIDDVHFKNDRLYHHNVMRINYTTYDVRRSQDNINPGTDHRDIMLLSFAGPDSPCHQFVYARVLGIYHVNVIYTGPGMVDYHARRMEFLWVRWYEDLDDIPVEASWSRRRLDRLQFPPMEEEGSFGFIDPGNVLRGCHIKPAFAFGLRHSNGMGISECAKNGKDWKIYYVNR